MESRLIPASLLGRLFLKAYRYLKARPFIHVHLLLLGAGLFAIVAASGVFWAPADLATALKYAALLTMALLLACLFLHWFVVTPRAHLNSAEAIRRNGYRFLAWFTAHNLAWFCFFAAGSLGLLWLAGPTTAVLCAAAGAIACACVCLAGVLRPHSISSLTLCWNSDAPTWTGNSWKFLAETLVLRDRLRFAIDKDATTAGSLAQQLAVVMDVDTAAPLDLTDPQPAQWLWLREIRNRLLALTPYYLATFLLAYLAMALTPGFKPNLPQGGTQFTEKTDLAMRGDPEQRKPKPESSQAQTPPNDSDKANPDNGGGQDLSSEENERGSEAGGNGAHDQVSEEQLDAANSQTGGPVDDPKKSDSSSDENSPPANGSGQMPRNENRSNTQTTGSPPQDAPREKNGERKSDLDEAERLGGGTGENSNPTSEDNFNDLPNPPENKGSPTEAIVSEATRQGEGAGENSDPISEGNLNKPQNPPKSEGGPTESTGNDEINSESRQAANDAPLQSRQNQGNDSGDKSANDNLSKSREVAKDNVGEESANRSEDGEQGGQGKDSPTSAGNEGPTENGDPTSDPRHSPNKSEAPSGSDPNAKNRDGQPSNGKTEPTQADAKDSGCQSDPDKANGAKEEKALSSNETDAKQAAKGTQSRGQSPSPKLDAGNPAGKQQSVAGQANQPGPEDEGPEREQSPAEVGNPDKPDEPKGGGDSLSEASAQTSNGGPGTGQGAGNAEVNVHASGPPPLSATGSSLKNIVLKIEESESRQAGPGMGDSSDASHPSKAAADSDIRSNRTPQRGDGLEKPRQRLPNWIRSLLEQSERKPASPPPEKD